MKERSSFTSYLSLNEVKGWLITMKFDIIVFSQQELTDALNAGYKFIALCDNRFSLPDDKDIHYTLIGNVSIERSASDTASDRPACTDDMPPAHFSSFTSSFPSSFASSYSSYEYEYEYASSFGSSYASSFISSYYSFISGMPFSFGSGSFVMTGSYAGSFGWSFAGSFGLSFAGSFADSYAFASSGGFLPDIIEYGSSGIIFVNGYGINLI